MREKIYEFAIDKPLTATKRKAIDQHIARNAHLSPSTVTHDWDGETKQVLRIATPPVKWEVRFDAKIVEIYGTAPIWARLLFTKKKRTFLKDQIELLLRDTGLLKAEEASAQSPKKRKNARRSIPS